MSNQDTRFVSRLLKEKSDKWLRLGVAEDMIDITVRPIYHYVLTHYHRYGRLPAIAEVRDAYPDFRFLKAREELEYYAERIRAAAKSVSIRKLLTEVADSFSGGNVEEAAKILIAKTNELQRIGSNSPGMDYDRAVTDILEDIKEGVSGCISFGSPVLDEDLIGMEVGDWALIAGTAAAGKTWVITKLAMEIWQKEQIPILYLSLELSKKMIKRRMNSLIAGISYDRFRRNMLTDDERADTMRKVKELNRGVPFIVLDGSDHDHSCGRFGSLDSIRLKVREFKPVLLVVDGLYLGMNMDKWGETVNYANEFHASLRELGIRAMASTQLKAVADASNPKLGDLAFTSAFQQATDFVFMLAKDEKMRAAGYTVCSIGKAREAMDCQKYMIEFNPGEKINFVKGITNEFNPLRDAVEESDEEDDKPKRKRRKKLL